MKRRNILIITGSLIVLLITTTVIVFLNSNSKKEPSKPKQTQELASIKEYGYTLEDRDKKLFKGLFKELETELKKEEPDFKIYATLVSKLYVVDLYTIDNKVNLYDVGGIEFLHPDARANFELKVQDTIYKYVEDNSYDERSQKLPIVESIEVKELKETKIKVGEKTYDGYNISLEWSYEEDLGYDKSCVLEVANIEDKLYIVKQNVSEE